MDNAPGSGLLVIERILRDRNGVWRQIIDENGLRRLTGQMLGSSAISLALYGAVLGASNGWLQALSSAVKLPLLFLATLAICLPTLYLFNLVFGAKLSVLQATTLIMVSITVTSVLTLAFAPISLFFLISARNYEFFKLLNVGILVLTAFVGLRFLTGGMRALNDHQELVELTERQRSAPAVPAEAAVAADDGATPVAAGVPVSAAAVTDGATTLPVPHQPLVPGYPPYPGYPGRPPYQQVPRQPAPARPATSQRPTSMTLLYVWILLFGFVGTQLGWTLRPFFGDPGKPFALFRSLEGTFYADIFNTIGRLIGG